MDHTIISSQLETLAAAYDQRLQEIEDYANLPAPVRGAVATQMLTLISACLETGSEAQFLQFLRARIDERVQQGFTANSIEQALAALEQTLMPAVTNHEAAIFLWRLSSQAHAIISQRTTQLLRESEIKFHNIIKATPLGMHFYTLQADNRLVFTGANPAADKLLGVDNTSFIGQTIEEAFPGLVQTEVPEQYRQVAAAGQMWQTEQIAYHEGQIQGAFEVRAFQTEPGQMVASFSDITERKRLEQEIRQSLERRARQVQTSAEVAQQIAAAPALEELFSQVVNLVQSRFGYYHAHLYLLEGDNMVMQAGSGEAGRRLKELGHKIPLSAEKSLVVQTMWSGEPVLVTDVSQEPAWLPNPLLPDTQAELVVPITLGVEMLGVLDVQSDKVGGITADDQLLLLGLCGQIASAIESVRRFEEATIFKQFAEASSEGIGWATLEGKIVYFNPALSALCGEAAFEAIDQHIAAYYPEEAQQRLQIEILPEVLQSGSWFGELPLKTKQGQIIPTLNNFFLVRDQSGQARYLANIVTDITERKRTEAEMAENLRQMQSIQRAMSREGWSAFQDSASLPEGYLFNQITIQPAPELWLPELDRPTAEQPLISSVSNTMQIESRAAVAPLLAHDEIIGALGVYTDPQRPLSPDELTLVEAVSEQVALALESARLFTQTQQASALLNERVKELNCLNEISREITESPPVPELLQWVTERIPPAMRYPQLCQAAIEYEDTVFGRPEAVNLPRQITHALRIGNEVIGRVYIAYTEQRDFLDEESALIGGIAGRLSGYIENRRLVEQVQQRAAALEEATNFMDSIIENLPVMLFVKEAQDLRHVRWNRTGLELLGMKAEDLLGKNDYDFFPPEEADFFVAKDRETIRGGQMLDIPEEPIQTADKGLRWLNTRKVPIYGADGQPKYLLGISVDITERKENEESLRYEEARFRRLFEESPIAIWEEDFSLIKGYVDHLHDQGVKDFRAYFEQHPEEVRYYAQLGQVLDVNPRTLQLYQAADKAEFLERLGDIFGPETLETFKAEMMAVAEGKTRFESETLHYTLTGDKIYISLNWSVAPGYEHNYSRMIVSVVDITERKQAEETLRQSEQRLELILEAAALGTWDLNPQTGEDIVNERAVAMLGYTLDEVELQVKWWDERIHPDDFAQIEPMWQAHLVGETPFYEAEYRLRAKAGGWTWILDRGKIIERDPEDRPLRVTGIHLDITERKQVEAEREQLLAEVEAAYRQFVTQQWDKYLTEAHQGQWQVEYQPITPTLAPARVEPAKQKSVVSAPLILQGQAIGSLTLEDVDPNRRWSEEELALVEAVSEQLALTVENLRLFEDTQKLAAREQLTRQITDKMRAAPDFDSIIEVGVQELARVLGRSHVMVKLTTDNNPS